MFRHFPLLVRNPPSATFPKKLSSHTSPVEKPPLVPLPRKYDAYFVESRWYDWWICQGYFTPVTTGSNSSTGRAFAIILPPPNVTGSLHLGHALTIAIENALVRWNRLQGSRVLWIPGLDHAGIATQVQVEKKLWEEKRQTRSEIGVDRFLKEAEAWKTEKSQVITKQVRRLGAVVDWSRLSFTLDDKIQDGVREAFIRLFDQKKIYRQERLVNWCSHLQSTISDIEVEHKEVPAPTTIEVPGEKDPVKVGWMSYIAYPLADSANREEIVVGTTRLETVLGDVAVAVNPQDQRFSHYRDREVVHPILGTRLPIICDQSVEPTIGTGALKITPAHDLKDFETGTRHKLPLKKVIDDHGRMISDIPELDGLTRFQARIAIESILVNRNLWRGQHPHPMAVPCCSRSGDIIEPQLKKQWFLNCKEYAQRAMVAVSKGDLTIVPARFEKIWQQWLIQEKDWCLSRQLCWGQQIPAFKTVVDGKEFWTAAHNSVEAAKKLAALVKPIKLKDSDKIPLDVVQDPDVLDTWFTSSALPFVTLGWPARTAELFNHYPLSLMETGHDILFFWVARMVFMGYALTNQLPFPKVMLHGLVCDKHGKKMSKSVGNVIDPMDIVCSLEASDAASRNTSKIPIGADALNFALCRYETQQQFISFDVKSVEEANKFCNKIWQAFHLCQPIWEKFPPIEGEQWDTIAEHTDSGKLLHIWILTCFKDLILTCEDAFAKLTLDIAANSLHQFWYEKFCDVYLESIKPIVTTNNAYEQQNLSHALFVVFYSFLKLLSPFMPNLAEELYQRLPIVKAESVCKETIPFIGGLPVHENLLSDMDVLIEIARTVKNIRTQYGLMKGKVPMFIFCEEPLRDRLAALRSTLVTLSRSSSCDFLSDLTAGPEGCAVQILNGGIRVYVHLKDYIDVVKEVERYDKEKLKLQLKLNEVQEARMSKRYERMQGKAREETDLKISTLRERIGEIERVQEKVRTMK